MFRTVSTLTLGFLLVLTGCPGDDSTTTTGASAGTSTSAGTSASATDPSADTTEGPATASTTNTPGTTTDTPGTTTDVPGTTTGSADVCAPEAADDECGMCVKSMCCTELEACDADPEGLCQCFQDCAEMNPGVAGAIQCGMDCEVNPLGAGPTGDLASCSQAGCPVCLE